MFFAATKKWKASAGFILIEDALFSCIEPKEMVKNKHLMILEKNDVAFILFWELPKIYKSLISQTEDFFLVSLSQDYETNFKNK